MKSKARFIRSVIEAARQNEAEMPWARGSGHASYTASRTNSIVLPRIKTA